MVTRPKKLLPRSRRHALTRSQVMGRIRSSNTKPERLVRSLVHGLGLRFRNEARDLPGNPDLVNRSAKWAIFVHGCFWHQHDGCQLASSPRTNTSYWTAKLARNKERDSGSLVALRAMGYRVLVVWECETRATAPLIRALAAFLRKRSPRPKK